jgi:hypothetical protein
VAGRLLILISSELEGHRKLTAWQTRNSPGQSPNRSPGYGSARRPP